MTAVPHAAAAQATAPTKRQGLTSASADPISWGEAETRFHDANSATAAARKPKNNERARVTPHVYFAAPPASKRTGHGAGVQARGRRGKR